MIELFGSIASILGFSIQMQEKFAGAKPTENQIVFAGLVALSSASKSWKTLHSKYHPLSKSFSGVLAELSEHRHAIIVPRSPGSIAPNELRELFFDGILNDAILNFRGNTRREVRDISSSLVLEDPETQKHLQTISHANKSLSDEFCELCDLKKDALVIHDKFLEYLDTLKQFVCDPAWDQSHVSYLLDQRSLIAVDLPQMIYVTDRVLMTYLDVYIRIVSEYAGSRGYSNLLAKN